MSLSKREQQRIAMEAAARQLLNEKRLPPAVLLNERSKTGVRALRELIPALQAQMGISWETARLHLKNVIVKGDYRYDLKLTVTLDAQLWERMVRLTTDHFNGQEGADWGESPELAELRAKLKAARLSAYPSLPVEEFDLADLVRALNERLTQP